MFKYTIFLCKGLIINKPPYCVRAEKKKKCLRINLSCLQKVTFVFFKPEDFFLLLYKNIINLVY